MFTYEYNNFIQTDKIYAQGFSDKYTQEVIRQILNVHCIETMSNVIIYSKKANLRAFFDLIVIDGVPGNIKWKDGKVY